MCEATIDVTRLQGVNGDTGAQGLQGPPGTPGSAANLSFYTVLVDTSGGGSDAMCNAGDNATGGGGYGDSGAFGGRTTVQESRPLGNPPTGWHVQTDTFAVTFPHTFAYVVCAHVG